MVVNPWLPTLLVSADQLSALIANALSIVASHSLLWWMFNILSSKPPTLSPQTSAVCAGPVPQQGGPSFTPACVREASSLFTRTGRSLCLTTFTTSIFNQQNMLTVIDHRYHMPGAHWTGKGAWLCLGLSVESPQWALGVFEFGSPVATCSFTGSVSAWPCTGITVLSLSPAWCGGWNTVENSETWARNGLRPPSTMHVGLGMGPCSNT